MYSVVTNLVTSLEFTPIHSATTLCLFGRIRKGYVATQFIYLSITAESSATSGYVVIPERFSQNEEPAGRNEEWARKKFSFVPSSGFNRPNIWTHVNMNSIHQLYVLYFMYNFLHLVYFLVISSYGKSFWSFVYVVIYSVGAGKITLMSISDGLDPYLFQSKDGMTWSMKEEMDGEMFISRQSWHFSFIDNMTKVLFPNCILNWRVRNCVSRQGKGINTRNESTIFITWICRLWYCIHFLKLLTVCIHWDFSLIMRGDQHFCYKIKKSFQFSQVTELFPQNHGNVEE